jgi:hypothetical protein
MSAEQFWSVIHSQSYEALAVEALELREYAELERREDEDTIYRKIRVMPTIPTALLSLVQRVRSDWTPEYFEEQWRSQRAMEVQWKVTPFMLAERARIEGEVRVEPIDGRSCDRILEGDVSVRFPGVGGLIERAIVSTTVKSYEKSAEVANQLAADS